MNIKKIILATVMMSCYLSQITAQVNFGLKGGINFDNFMLKNAKEQLTFENVSGWQAGALLQFNIPAVGVSIQPELLYTASKAYINEKANSIYYFEVPVNLQWGINLKVVRPYIQGGPYFGYALKTDGECFKDNISRYDWGVALGAGIEIWKFQLSGRYQWGLQNISDKADFDLKINRFNLSLGFLF